MANAKYEIVVVGAGNAGLSAALQSVLAGRKTLLIEQHNLPGGCATSFRRGRFEIEPSLHEICDLGPVENPGDVRTIMDQYGVKVEWRRVDDCFRIISKYSDGAPMDVTMPSGIEPFIDKMEEYVPGSRPQMTKLFDLFQEVLDGSRVSRPYSISSGPKEALEGRIAVTVRANPGGFAADRILAGLKVGDAVTASAPEGHFYYEELRDAKNVLALAGGSGITPFLSMARAIRDGSENFALTILFGSRTKESILFAEELNAIAAACPKVKVVHVLSDEEAEGYEHGFITAELIRKYAPAEEYSVFLCGPEAMYRFVMPEVEKLALPRRLVRREMLGVTKNVAAQPGYPAGCAGKTFRGTVKQGAEEYAIDVAADEPILVALERAGIKAPSRCRSGECGWCRSKLVSGEVYCPDENEGRRHSDAVNGYIHPCSAFALSDIVIEVPGEFY